VAKTIAIVNQKGGVGKTTTCVNLTAALTNQGKKVLMCDFDPQANSTSGMGVDKTASKGVYEVLIESSPTIDAVVHTRFGDVLPSNKALAGAGIELIGMDRREFLLKDALAQIADQYDYILIDCPPSLGMLTVNALAASDGVVIPMQCEFYALEGLTQLLSTVGRIKKRYNPYLAIYGILVTMYNRRLLLSTQVMEQLQQHYREKLFSLPISRNVKLSEAPGFGCPVYYHDKTSKGSKEYMQVAKELVERAF